MPRSKKKIFVLDTNVILHDSACIHQFEENDIVVPITVLEELDHFKVGHDTLNFHAREFVRNLDTLSGDKLFDGGVTIGPGLGNISIKLERKFHEDLAINFPANVPDHHILNIAYYLAKETPKTPVILVTKDVGLRMKAKAIRLMAQDYRNDHVENIQSLYSGHRIVNDVSPDLLNRFYSEPFTIDASELLPIEDDLTPNEYMILRNERHSVLATFDGVQRRIKRVDKIPAYGIISRNAEQTFALDALMNPDIKLVSLSGKAGTGKTLLALAAALECRKLYTQIYMARPIVPLSNKDIGFLPGDIKSKLDPYMQPLFDNLGVIRNQFPESNPKHKRIKELLEEEKLVISPLSYIRGRSLVKIYFIVDEAQNLTPHEIKTIITRAGDGTKLVFTGDIFQIDHPYLDIHSNGLCYLIDKMKSQKLYAHVNLEKGERSELAELASNLL
ncbi:MAG: PhoH family protein [Candidatus Marinimicrobia bacterium]|nr:PhoH family protein [Candidatus Neomarinimicrobiota bacterium]